MRKLALTVAAIAAVAVFVARSGSADALNAVIPAPAVDMPATGASGPQTIVLAGGCFWGMQGMFEHVQGVTKVVAGYSGGAKDTAHYELVGTETTGHAESVQITYDPKQISYGQILRLYFSVAHDPTQLDRQGPDSGPSYRSAIFVASPEQEKVARAYIEQLEKAGTFGRPIVTKLEPFKGFYAAEGYHQDYLIHHPESMYIRLNDQPKIAALKKVYPQMYRDKPVMVGR